MLRVDGGEQLAVLADALGRAEEQKAVGIERVMQDRQHATLKGVVHVDEDIPATHQIEARERRIARHVVPREDAQIADAFADLVMAVDADEESAEPLGRDVDLDVVDVDPGPGPLEGRVVDVGGEDLDGHVIGRAGEILQKADRDGIDFFAGGAAGHPDADRLIPGPARENRGKDLFLEEVERFRIAEELRDADEEILEEVVELGRIGSEHRNVVVDRLDVAQRHPPLDASLDRRSFVVGEVDVGVRPQEPDDLLEAVPLVELVGRARGERPRIGMIRKAEQVPRDPLRRQDVVDAAVRDRAARHAVLLRRLLVLGERDAALGLDRLEPERPVRAAARQDDADRLGAVDAGHRAEQMVDRHVRPARQPRRQPDMAVAESERLVRGDDVDVVRVDRDAVLRFLHLHRRHLAEDLGELTLVRRL